MTTTGASKNVVVLMCLEIFFFSISTSENVFLD